MAAFVEEHLPQTNLSREGELAAQGHNAMIAGTNPQDQLPANNNFVAARHRLPSRIRNKPPYLPSLNSP